MTQQGAPESPGPAPGRRAGVIDLLAFLAVIAFATLIVLPLAHSGKLAPRLAIAGAAALVAGGAAAWRRLRWPAPRRWRSGQVTVKARHMSLVSSWGVEGQPPPLEAPPAGQSES